LCGSSIAVPKKHNIEPHFQTNHGTFNVNYPLKSEVRKKKICNLKSSLTAQQTVFTRHVENSKKKTLLLLSKYLTCLQKRRNLSLMVSCLMNYF
jgi:hypothetical protein